LAEAGYNVTIFEWNYKAEPRNLGPLVKNFHIHEKGLDAKILEKRAINTFIGDYNGVEYIELLPKFDKVTRIFVEQHSDLVSFRISFSTYSFLAPFGFVCKLEFDRH
jgi:hypothetical protein